jgi:DNA-binding MarR family transcriptional regulator
MSATGSDLSDRDYTSLAETRRLLRSYLAFSEHAAETAGLEPRQYQMLLMLRGLGDDGVASVSQLADWLQVRHHSAVGLVDRMTDRGLVHRRRDAQDGRRVLVGLTPSGHSALKALAVLHRSELRRLAPGLLTSFAHLLSGTEAPPVGPPSASALALANSL